MNFREMIREAWFSLTPGRRAAVCLMAAALGVLLCSGWFGAIRSWNQVRKLEADAVANKRAAAEAMERANKIALEKLEVEKTLAELEVKIDAKHKEANDAHVKTLDARADYYRTLREQRGDAPSAEQLCRESAALGYPCE